MINSILNIGIKIQDHLKKTINGHKTTMNDIVIITELLSILKEADSIDYFEKTTKKNLISFSRLSTLK